MDKDWFLALDGDDIGRQLEFYIVSEDLEGLQNFISAFEHALDKFFKSVDENPSIGILLRGGDSLLLAMPRAELEGVIKDVKSTMRGTSFTFSGGYGHTMRDAYLALKIAKATGKDKIVSLDSGERQ